MKTNRQIFNQYIRERHSWISEVGLEKRKALRISYLKSFDFKLYLLSFRWNEVKEVVMEQIRKLFRNFV
jgi:hypothetical protein